MGTLDRLGAENFAAMATDLDGLDVEWEATGDLFVALEPHEVTPDEPGWLDAEAIRAEVDSPTYLGGLLNREGSALVHPAKLADALRREALDRGVRIHERSGVRALERAGAGVRVRTDGGVVTARGAIVAAGAYPSPARTVARYVAPVYDYALMTEPLDAQQRDAIGWNGRQGISDGGNRFHYYRRSADNRILFGGFDAVYRRGGPVGPDQEDHDPTFAALARNFFVTFPQLEGLRFSHRWGGAIDTCSRFSVFFGSELGGRVVYAAGYTGSASAPRGSGPASRSTSSTAPTRRRRAWRSSAGVPSRSRPSRSATASSSSPATGWRRRIGARAVAVCGSALWIGSAWASTASAAETVHVPPDLGSGPVPLLVMIHGCGTTPAEQQAANLYDPIADREHFVVLYPDDADTAHTGGCWHWYDPSSWSRDSGDPAAVAATTRAAMAKYPIDPERVYAMGMSSGALITSDVVATYPDLFAAFGLMAGGPYEGVGCLNTSVGNHTETLADSAFKAEGTRARILPFIVLHGDRDRTIAPECGRIATEQWLRTDNLVASGKQTAPLSLAPARTESPTPKADGYPYDVQHFTDPGGCEIAQRWTIHGMDHFWSGGSSEPGLARFTDPRGPSAAAATWAFFSRYTRAQTDLPCAETTAAAAAPVKPKARPRRCRHRRYRRRHPRRCLR